MMESEKILIRMMNDEDIPFVYSIEKESFSDLWSEGTYRNYKTEIGQNYFIAEQDGGIAAYCVVMQVLDECEILKIAVDKSHRRKGIGEELLRAVMKETSQKGARLFYLEVREGNKSAINLYKKIGFTETGRRKSYYKKPTEDAVLMSCVI